MYVYIHKFTCECHSQTTSSSEWRPENKGQKTRARKLFLVLSADKETCNYDIECSDHHPSLSTLRPKGLSRNKIKWWAIHTNLPVNVIARLPHPRIGDSQGQKTFLAPSADKQTRNYDKEWSNHHPSLSTLGQKKLSRSKMKWWAIYTNLSVNVIVRLPHLGNGYIYFYIYFYISIYIFQNSKLKTRCVGVLLNQNNTFFILTKISVVLHNLVLQKLQCVWIKHLTKSLHTQQKWKTN